MNIKSIKSSEYDISKLKQAIVDVYQGKTKPLKIKHFPYWKQLKKKAVKYD